MSVPAKPTLDEIRAVLAEHNPGVELLRVDSQENWELISNWHWLMKVELGASHAAPEKFAEQSAGWNNYLYWSVGGVVIRYSP